LIYTVPFFETSSSVVSFLSALRVIAHAVGVFGLMHKPLFAVMGDVKTKEVLRGLEGAMGEDIEKVMTTEVIHDFKNILTGILGNLALAKDWSNPKDPAYPFIEAAERVTRHANQLAMQLLSSARGAEREHFPFSLARLLRDSVDLMIGGSHCTSKLEIARDLKQVSGDEARIAQVLNNLLENARQAMPEGGMITVSAANVLVSSENKYKISSGKYVAVLVEDQGWEFRLKT
jgi:two-component system, cell cycle sensor histidine kinase and response regulator CckA